MNKDQVKGPVKEATDKPPAKSGPAMGSDSQHAKSVTPPAEGHDPKKASVSQPSAKDRADKL